MWGLFLEITLKYIFRYCPNCGVRATNDNNKCVVCGDMYKACLSKEETGKSNFYKFVVAFMLLLAFLLFLDTKNKEEANSAEQTTESASEQVYFDFDLGKEKYANWVKDNGVYRNDYLNISALIERSKYGARVVFIEPSTTCTEGEDSGFVRVLQVNSKSNGRTPVKFVKHCYSRGWAMYEPFNKEENEIVIDAFKKSNDVLVNGLWNDAIFSALGFTDAYNFMNQ